TLGVNADTENKWLCVEEDKRYQDFIVIGRSSRYQNPHISYSFLNKYEKLLFVGVESEYKEILHVIPHIKWRQVRDFKELAEIIAGCRFFIGNQSFPFSLAEALKVNRILETSFETPNVIPRGNQGYDFFLQDHLEWLVE